MSKKIFFNILIFFIISSCGYQPIYSNKDKSNLRIKEIIFKGNNQINDKIVSLIKLEKNTSDPNGLKIFLESAKKNEISSKDNSGNPLTFLLTINSNIKIESDKKERQKNFKLSFAYSNKENKFDLNEYQKTIEQNLIISLSEKILMYLNLDQ